MNAVLLTTVWWRTLFLHPLTHDCRKGSWYHQLLLFGCQSRLFFKKDHQSWEVNKLTVTVYFPRKWSSFLPFPRAIGWWVLVEGKLIYRRKWIENMFSLSPPPSLLSLKCSMSYLLLMSHVWKYLVEFFPLEASVALNSLLWFSSPTRCWHGTREAKNSS